MNGTVGVRAASTQGQPRFRRYFDTRGKLQLINHDSVSSMEGIACKKRL